MRWPSLAEAKPWKDYRPLFVTDKRIDDGVAFYRENRALLERVGKEYGVPPEIIVAIVGVETSYGRITGKYRVIDALSTLAFHYPPRAAFFRGELKQLFLLGGTHPRRIQIDELKGSYAGAMGWGQFMPTSIAQWAKDEDGDGRIDLWNSLPDILSSVAYYFAAHGWENGLPVAVGAQPAANAQDVLAEGIEPKTPVQQMEAWGYAPLSHVDPGLVSTLLVLDGDRGSEYWLTFRNFYVITRYNKSPLYSMAVWQLAGQIADGVVEAPTSGAEPAQYDAPLSTTPARARRAAVCMRASQKAAHRRHIAVGSSAAAHGDTPAETSPASRALSRRTRWRPRAAGGGCQQARRADAENRDARALRQQADLQRARPDVSPAAGFARLRRARHRVVVRQQVPRLHDLVARGVRHVRVQRRAQDAAAADLCARDESRQRQERRRTHQRSACPFHENRLKKIDLSYAAAGAHHRRLAEGHRGLVEVRAIDPAHPDATPAPLPHVVTAEAASSRIYLQLGAFGDRANAERVAGAANRGGIDHVDIQSAGVNGHTVHRVRVGPLADVAAADALTPRIERLGFGARRAVAIER